MNHSIDMTSGTTIGARLRAGAGQVELDVRNDIGDAVLSAYKGVFVGPCGRPAVIGREAPTV